MANIGNLAVVLSLDAAQYGAGLSAVEDRMKKFNADMGQGDGDKLKEELGPDAAVRDHRDGQLLLFSDAAFLKDLPGKAVPLPTAAPGMVRQLALYFGAGAFELSNGPCGEERPLRAFNRDGNNPDGLLRRCKGCEARRVADYKREWKRLREGGGGA